MFAFWQIAPFKVFVKQTFIYLRTLVRRTLQNSTTGQNKLTQNTIKQKASAFCFCLILIQSSSTCSTWRLCQSIVCGMQYANKSKMAQCQIQHALDQSASHSVLSMCRSIIYPNRKKFQSARSTCYFYIVATQSKCQLLLFFTLVHGCYVSHELLLSQIRMTILSNTHHNPN